MKALFKNGLSLALCLGASSLAFSEDKSAEQRLKAAELGIKTGVFDMMDKKEVVVGFGAGSAALSETEKSNLTALVRSLDTKAINNKVVVASWSDLNYPAGPSDELPKAAVDLAAKRQDVVEDYLRSLGTFHSIESFNMAKHSSIFARVFRTDDAQLKDEMAGKDTKDAEMDAVANVLKEKGKPSSVVVMFYSRNSMMSH